MASSISFAKNSQISLFEGLFLAVPAEARANQELRFSPHYVVLITDESLVMDHVIMEYFAKDPTSLGCSLIFVQDIMRSLSENVQTVVRVKDQLTGELVMGEGVISYRTFNAKQALELTYVIGKKI
ncbi:DNA translocase FtsK [Streptococcus macacae NCTC 11558]|uniref:Uncharacterized protein n=1 Tax=Streptococcus macacae NCTC 11558 TaxID=764298 RepID=G5JXW6_9STRE|nr:hypothetical protein [Streptococcus macacae]EHJ53372.1 hypothetical protein STRMA_0011 [Streptococcus macacae NCTC 11558]SUN77887.1 DNA translocase FtsK [Streptococcus macacae NCTC 11558]